MASIIIQMSEGFVTASTVLSGVRAATVKWVKKMPKVPALSPASWLTRGSQQCKITANYWPFSGKGP